jgi:hypothetical protein
MSTNVYVSTKAGKKVVAEVCLDEKTLCKRSDGHKSGNTWSATGRSTPDLRGLLRRHGLDDDARSSKETSS